MKKIDFSGRKDIEAGNVIVNKREISYICNQDGKILRKILPSEDAEEVFHEWTKHHKDIVLVEQRRILKVTRTCFSLDPVES